MFKGHAQPSSTLEFLQSKGIHQDQQRNFCDVSVSSIAVGTYLGGMDFSTDQAVIKACNLAAAAGINFFDSAINYRGQRAEKSVGEALKQLFLKGVLRRDQTFISTKGGFVPYEGNPETNLVELFKERYVNKGIAALTDLVAECHCMHPKYLDNQLDASRQNLGVETIDLYYVHNPETQLEEYPERIFYERLFETFTFLEKARSEGRLVHYGLATWDGLREPPQSQGYLSLEKVIHVADAAAPHGDSGFRAVQMPLNFAMLEGRLMGTQEVASGENVGPMGAGLVSAIEAAAAYGLDVAISAPLLQGQLAEELPDFILKHFDENISYAEIALSFALSLSGVGAAMVGMKRPEHVSTNSKVLTRKNLDPAKIQAVLKSLATGS